VRPLAATQAVENALPANFAFQCNLDDAQRLGQLASILHVGGNQHEELVCRRIAHELQVIGRVLVVACDVERHHLLKEGFGDGVEGEEGVTVDGQELALGRVRAAVNVGLGLGQRRVQAQELVQPLLDSIALGVSDGLRQGDFPQLPRGLVLFRLGRLAG